MLEISANYFDEYCMERSSKVNVYAAHLPFSLNESACCSTAQAKKILPYDKKAKSEACKGAGNVDDAWCISETNSLQANHYSEIFKCLQTDDLNLFLSDMVICSAEQAHWDQLKAGFDFSQPVPARALFEKCNGFRELLDVVESNDSNARQIIPSPSSSPQRREGNSIFYEYSTAPSTSRSADEKLYREQSSSSGEIRSSFSARGTATKRLRESMRNAIFTTYFGKRRPMRRSSSTSGAFNSAHETSTNVLTPSAAANSGVAASSTEMESPTTDVEDVENEWKCLASFIDFPQELVALPSEISHQHRLVRSTSGKQYIRRRRRHSSSSSTSSNRSVRSWAPPRRKFIYDLPTAVNYKDFAGMLAQQDNRCAGCSRLFDDASTKRSRICYYYSKLFCPCCHQGTKYVIPAQILHNWSFKELLVCDAALTFLRDNADQPVFNIPEINPLLYGRVKALRRARDLRIQASHMWQYIQLCPLAEHIETSHGYLKTMFTSVTRRFLCLENVHMYSILDLVSVFNQNLLQMLQPLVDAGRQHIEHCLECRHQAFFCQICGNDSDVLFPFQLERVHRCEACGALSHVKCRVQALKARRGEPLECAKCERIRRKRIRQFQRSPSQKSVKLSDS